MHKPETLIVVVEDDSSLRRALERLLAAVGYRIRVFESAEAVLMAHGENGAACLVLDIALPGQCGLALYAALGPGRPPAIPFSPTTARHSAVRPRSAVPLTCWPSALLAVIC